MSSVPDSAPAVPGSPSCRILEQTGPVPFAHRGGAALWPENTAPAFIGCQELGQLVIETDVRATADGQLVIFHDDRLERTTNGHGRLADKSLRQLLALDAGYWFTKDGESHPFRGRNLRILTLDEALRLVPDASWNVELKPGHPESPKLLNDFLARVDHPERFLVASHDHETLCRFRQLSAGRFATSASRREAFHFVARQRSETWGGLEPRYQALQVPPHAAGQTVVTPQMLTAAHSLGVQVHVWTINDATEMEELLAMGVDGLMSDRPDVLLDVMRARSGNNA